MKQQAKRVADTKGKKPYAPKLNSCPYAVLIALYLACGEDAENWRTVGMEKEELAKQAQKFTTTDMMAKVQPKGDKSGWGYSGLSCIKTLVEKNMVRKKGRQPVLHYLTDAGLRVARECTKRAVQEVWALPDELDEEGQEEEKEDERPKKKAKAVVASLGKGKKKAVASEEESEEERPVPKKPRASTSRLPAAVDEDSNDEEREFVFLLIKDYS